MRQSVEHPRRPIVPFLNFCREVSFRILGSFFPEGGIEPIVGRGLDRVSQYLIASGYECCLDTPGIARREGLECIETANRERRGWNLPLSERS